MRFDVNMIKIHILKYFKKFSLKRFKFNIYKNIINIHIHF